MCGASASRSARNIAIIAGVDPSSAMACDAYTDANALTLALLPTDLLRQVWNLSDIDRDGPVSFDEFCAMFHQHVGAPSAAKTASHATQEVTAAFAAK